jgi:hypothetical protein
MFSVSAELVLIQFHFGNPGHAHPPGNHGCTFPLFSPEEKGVSDSRRHTGTVAAPSCKGPIINAFPLGICAFWDFPAPVAGFFNAPLRAVTDFGLDKRIMGLVDFFL